MSGRIRSLKPEWRESESLGRCSDAARVLSATLITLSDDYGNGRGTLEYLAAQTWMFSRDPRESLAKARAALRELVAIGYVAIYAVDNSTYFHLTGWGKHQKVDKPGKPRVPEPSPGLIRESLAKVPETLAPDHDHDHDHERDQEQEGEREREGEGRSPKAREAVAPPEGAEALAEELREHLVAEKPDHQIADDDAWARRRAAWTRGMGALLSKGREASKASTLMAWVFGDQGGAEFRFRVDSPKALGEKWDRIEVAMVRARGTPLRGTPVIRDRAAEIWAEAQRLREQGR